VESTTLIAFGLKNNDKNKDNNKNKNNNNNNSNNNNNNNIHHKLCAMSRAKWFSWQNVRETDLCNRVNFCGTSLSRGDIVLLFHVRILIYYQ